ncbi:MAG: GNAT family N-acetyltransferase [Verrucomicrobiaceae bacterium]|nr:GNAT family N-acetyltransferase [Verrucomicrobiaceae bacterium]
MLEFALDKFPVSHTLSNGVSFETRPLKPEDEAAYEDFYNSLSEMEKFLIKHRHPGHDLFAAAEDVSNFEERLPLLAFVGDKVVAHASLHQRPGGWKRHVGMVGVLVHPDYRGIGLVKRIIDDLIEIAQHCGLTKLEAEFNGERKRAINDFLECGFRELVRLPDYLLDNEARPHDWVLLGMSTVTSVENAGAGD